MIEKIKEQIEPVIKLLNEKGYHILDYNLHVGGIRIIFDKKIKLPNIPKGYYFADTGKMQIIAISYMDSNKDLWNSNIDQYNLQLLNWALKLPDINNKKRGIKIWERIMKRLNKIH